MSSESVPIQVTGTQNTFLKNNGDVLEAIIDFEGQKPEDSTGFNKKKPEDLAKRLTEILPKGF